MSFLSILNTDPRAETEINRDIGQLNDASMSVASAAGTRVLNIVPNELSFDKQLGKGTSYVVNREVFSPSGNISPYYVAVKHVISDRDQQQLGRDAQDEQRRLRDFRNVVVARELRVLTALSSQNSHVIRPLLGYGWNDDPYGRRPFIVVEYSDHGNLPQYLKRHRRRRTLSMHDLREFALDVACGLRVLHDNRIVHGDLKPDNVLIFDVLHGERPQMAKLADFGGSIFEQDIFEGAIYGGTSLYNAPEQEGRGGHNPSYWKTMRSFYLADIWSFGLTLLEIIQHGIPYIDATLLAPGKTPLEFLEELCAAEQDAVLQLAKMSCGNLFFETEATIRESVFSVFDITLRDNPHERSGISEIIRVLAYGTTEERPISSYPRINYLPLPSEVFLKNHPPQLKIPFPTLGSSENWTAPDPKQTWAAQPLSDLTLSPRDFQIKSKAAAIFEPIMNQALPWETQQHNFENLVQYVATFSSKQPTAKFYDACLQIALCYLLGCGVRRNNTLMIEFLAKSSQGSEIAKAIYHRIISSMEANKDPAPDTCSSCTSLDEQLKPHENNDSYYSKRIILDQRMQIPMPLDVVGSGDKEISEALTLACRHGNAKMAMELSSRCKTFVADPLQPTPIHWLIMFDDEDARMVSSALVGSQLGDQVGLCRGYLDMYPSTGVLFVPEHCLELGGSPLHWAVRARNKNLVKLLLSLGANVDTRWMPSSRAALEITESMSSPLDIAVELHLSEIVKILLDSGAAVSPPITHLTLAYSAIHCLGRPCKPFARQLIHGAEYREALRRTIHVLLDRGLDINEKTEEDGYTPLLVALTDPDCEEYIIEELLAAGASVTCSPANKDLNPNIISAVALISRRYNDASLRLVAPFSKDFINEVGKGGKCAIHYAVLSGNGEAVNILSRVENFDANVGASNGHHLIHYAAHFNSIDAIKVLLTYGVDIDYPTEYDKWNYSPLMLAAMRRHIELTDYLLDQGANPFFTFIRSPRWLTLLHAASASAYSPHSLVKHLLDKHEKLRSKSIINAADHFGWTALHKAAYYGDADGIRALVERGADTSLRDRAGKTAHDQATKLLRSSQGHRLKYYKYVVENGQQGIADFEAALETIQDILEMVE
ncbi:ankyrin [Xylaria palmicola]|nr:ankyrin [Xylaria palmicola]